MDIYLVTGNINKKEEFLKMMNQELSVQFVNINLEEIQAQDIVEINEHKVKTAYNILKKQDNNRNKKLYVITDDTGLFINKLNNFPGPYIKWMQKALGSKGIADVVSRLDDNICHAVCTYSVYDGKDVHSFKGITNGKIVEPRGDNKFGWDNIFEPESLCKTFGEMTFDEKQKFSPRFKAFVQLKEFLMNEHKKYNNDF
ncbi:Ham1-like protein, putative [Plasmodium sp. DRC-Itaito]|nr:Ham1-like protein, putative [Plasmodium sp. DRC-Itaito]